MRHEDAGDVGEEEESRWKPKIPHWASPDRCLSPRGIPIVHIYSRKERYANNLDISLLICRIQFPQHPESILRRNMKSNTRTYDHPPKTIISVNSEHETETGTSSR